MYLQKDKQKENKSRTVTNFTSQRKVNRKQGFNFVDNRPEAVVQKQLIESLNSQSAAQFNIIKELRANEERAQSLGGHELPIQRVITDNDGNALGFNEIWEELEVFDNFDGFDELLALLMGPGVNVTLDQVVAALGGGGAGGAGAAAAAGA